MKYLLGFVTALVLLCDRTVAAERQPNIVLLMGNDHGWEETGYHGHPHVKTPVLDEMAAKGLRMDRFYAAHPSCSPTRAGFLIRGRSTAMKFCHSKGEVFSRCFARYSANRMQRPVGSTKVIAQFVAATGNWLPYKGDRRNCSICRKIASNPMIEPPSSLKSCAS